MASLPGFLWLIGLALGASASTPRSSLLEVKSNANKASVSVEMQSNRARLAEYSKFTEGMLAKYGQDPAPAAEGEAWNGQTSESAGSGIVVEDRSADKRLRETMKPTGTEFDAVRMVEQFIDDMTDSLKKYHGEDEERASSCNPTNIVSSCVADYLNNQTKDTLANKSKEVETKGDRHKTCREDAKQCYADMEESCPDYDKYRKQLYPYQDKIHIPYESYQDSTLPDCVKTIPDDYDHESLGTAGAFSDRSIKTDQEEQLATMELCLKRTKAWLDPLYTKYSACTRRGELCGEKLANCKKQQQQFEDDHCDWKMTQELDCIGLNTCGDTDTDKCNGYMDETAEPSVHVPGVCDIIELNEGYRNADYETGQRLMCLLNVIFGEPVDYKNETTEWYPPPANKTTALAGCKDESRYGPLADKIQCNPGQWVPPDPCADVMYQTCSVDFNTKWYLQVGLNNSCDDPGCSLEDQARNKNVDVCQANREVCI